MHISAEYAEQQRKLHETDSYGIMGRQFGPLISEMVDTLEINHLLDYGCGKNQSLRESLKPEREIIYQAYDPGWPEYAGEPKPAELVCCIDVLEHIEPEYLNQVLDHLEDLAQIVLFATITTCPAKKHLSDGRNAHLIQQPMEWWLPRILERFSLTSLQRVTPVSFFVVASNAEVQAETERRFLEKIFAKAKASNGGA